MVSILVTTVLNLLRRFLEIHERRLFVKISEESEENIYWNFFDHYARALIYL